MVRWIAPASAAGVASIFAALQLYALHPYEGDENIYLYLAQRAAEGARPWADFFHGHPPGHLLPAVLAFRALGGFTLGAARAIPVGAALLAALLLYRGARRLGPVEAVATVAVYLLSYHALVLSGHFLGASLCALWTAAALERVAAGRPAQAGLAFALAAGTLLSAAPAGAGVGAVLLLLDRRAAGRYAAAGLGAFALLNGAALAIYGPAYLDQVYLYHVGKADTGEGLSFFREFAYADPFLAYAILAGGAALALRLLADRGDRDESEGSEERAERDEGGEAPLSGAGRRWLLAAAAASAASVVFLAALPRIFTHYFLGVALCGAPLAGFAIAEIVRRARDAVRTRDAGRGLEAAVLIAVCGLGALPFAVDRAAEREPPGPQRWRGSGVAALDAVVRPLFWHDEKAPHTAYGPVTRHLWIAARAFDGAAVLAEEVRARSAPGETIFGDSTSVPLVALLADRRIALDEADTNAMRFRRTDGALEALLERLEAAPPRLVIGRPGFEILGFHAVRAWLDAHYVPVARLAEPNVQATYVIYARRTAIAEEPPAKAPAERDQSG